MLLLIYFVLLYCLFNFRKAATPGLLLISIYMVSLGCGLLIGYDYTFDTYFKIMNFLFLAVALTFFIVPWNRFKYKCMISEPNPKRLRTLTLWLFAINSITFVLFAIAIFYAFTTVTDYSAFKNLGESEGFIKQLPINHTLFLMALYLHPAAYFLIPLHFYYLSKNRYLYSLISLVLSLNIIFNGLMVFSRSGFIVYMLLYGLYLPFFYPKLSRRTKRTIKLSGLTLLSLTVFVFYIITENRFTNVLFYKQAVNSESIVTNPVVYSLLDYCSQWYKNSNEIMSMYSFETLKGELSFPLVLLIGNALDLIDYHPERIESTLYSLWGSYYDKFNGLVANLTFDFGYLGTIFFLFLYLVALRLLRPINGVLRFNSLLVLGVVFVLPAMGIFNSELKGVFYHVLIILSLMVYFFMMTKKMAKKNGVSSLDRALGF